MTTDELPITIKDSLTIVQSKKHKGSWVQDSENSTKIRIPKCQLIAVVLHNKIGTKKKNISCYVQQENYSNLQLLNHIIGEIPHQCQRQKHEHRLNQLFADYLPRKLFFWAYIPQWVVFSAMQHSMVPFYL